jgi:hypothetical protein
MSQVYKYLVSFTAAIGGLLFGYEIGVVSQVLDMKSFKDSFHAIGDSQVADLDGNVTFTFLAGCVLGILSFFDS